MICRFYLLYDKVSRADVQGKFVLGELGIGGMAGVSRAFE